MSDEYNENKKNKGAERQIIKDSYNASANMGRRSSRGSLTFTFDKDIKETSGKAVQRKPSSDRSVYRDGSAMPEKTKERQGSRETGADASRQQRPAARPEQKQPRPAVQPEQRQQRPAAEAGPKSYGLPDGYEKRSVPAADVPQKTPEENGAQSMFSHASDKFKRFVNERQEMIKAAKEAAAEKKKQFELEAAERAAKEAELAEKRREIERIAAEKAAREAALAEKKRQLEKAAAEMAAREAEAAKEKTLEKASEKVSVKAPENASKKEDGAVGSKSGEGEKKKASDHLSEADTAGQTENAAAAAGVIDSLKKMIETRKAEAEVKRAEAEARRAEEEARRAEAKKAAEEKAEAEKAEKAAAEKAKKKPSVAKPEKKMKADAGNKSGKPKTVKATNAAKAEKAAKAAKAANAAKDASGGPDGSGSAKSKDQKKNSGKQKKKKKKGKLWWLWAIIKIMLALIIVGGISGAAYAAYTISHAPVIHPDRIYDNLDVSSHIYDDNGKLLDDIYFSENREIVKYEQIPDNLKNAFIAIEDKTFWEHKGFNFRRMFGAVWNSVRGGGEISGTSTITQQLARNVFLPDEKSVRSIKRKIIEMYYAHELEEALTKEEILTAYLNTIYLGYGCYGVDTAAKNYFSRDIGELSVAQCASLAALPQAPGIYALLTTEDGDYCTEIRDGLYANDISRQRRDMVLDLMAEQGFITEKKAAKAKRPLTDFIKPGKENVASKSAFKDYLLQTVKKDLMAEYNLSDEQATEMVYAKGLHIYSTLNTQAQKVITKEFKNKQSFPDALKENAKVEAAMVIVEVGTGKIKAMAGTRSVNGEMLFNRAISPRQPGSSIKPIAVYAPALQKSYEYQKKGKKFPFKDTGYDSQGKKYWGNYITAISTVKDEKMTVNGKVWPQNFSRTYSGFRTFRTAIQQSINTCAVKILAQIGVDYSVDMVKKFGITTLIDDTDEPYNDVNLAAMGLGAMTEGVTPLEMALAYATFPNGGVYNSGICYTKVTDGDGRVLLKGKSETTRVLDKGVAFIMTDVLQSVVEDGIAYNAAISGEKVGGKTGTTDQTWDIWFDGFTANYAAALWIGTDDNTELNATSMVAASLWSKIMSQVKKAKGGTYKSKPDNVILQDGEYYTKGTQPPRVVVVKKDTSKDKTTNKTTDKNKKDSGNTGSNTNTAANTKKESGDSKKKDD